MHFTFDFDNELSLVLMNLVSAIPKTDVLPPNHIGKTNSNRYWSPDLINLGQAELVSASFRSMRCCSVLWVLFWHKFSHSSIFNQDQTNSFSIYTKFLNNLVAVNLRSNRTSSLTLSLFSFFCNVVSRPLRCLSSMSVLSSVNILYLRKYWARDMVHDSIIITTRLDTSEVDLTHGEIGIKVKLH